MNKWIYIVIITVCLCLPIFADKSYCRILELRPVFIKHCYTISTYKDCQSTCQKHVFSKRHKDQDCPWGDAPNAKGCNMINNLNFRMYCRRQLMNDILSQNAVIGMNCCGSCLETTGQTAPNRGKTWRDTYQGLY